MESLYWVLCWACHRKCRHCYEERFRPYVRAELEAVIAQAERNAPRILANLPEHMTYVSGDGVRRIGRVILSGGEALLDPVRQRVTYPTIRALVARYAPAGGVRVIVQTTGDLLTPAIVDELLGHGAWMISVAGLDDFHVGMEGADRQAEARARLGRTFAAAGMRPSGHLAGEIEWHDEPGPVFSFFGATPDSWIGKLWPRGRAWANGLSRATLADNFCNRWSGGLGFLRHDRAGSEVSIEPDGAVYPCCLKTKVPLGSLLEDRLIDILDSLADDPAFLAIDAGAPELMGLGDGWSVQEFHARSQARTPSGEAYANLCLGCDRFHEEVLGARIEAARQRRGVRPGAAPRPAAAGR